MPRRVVSKERLAEFVQGADTHSTTVHNTMGSYDAVVRVDGQAYRVSTPALDPEASGTIQEISDEKADRLIAG